MEQRNLIDNQLWKLFKVDVRVYIYTLLHAFMLCKRYYIKGTYVSDEFIKKYCGYRNRKVTLNEKENIDDTRLNAFSISTTNVKYKLACSCRFRKMITCV